MEELIQRIINLEERANQVVLEAKEEEKRISQEASVEVDEMSKHIHEMADTKITQLKGRTQNESDDRIIRIYGDTAMKMRLMEEQAEKEQTFWEDDIFNRIIRR